MSDGMEAAPLTTERRYGFSLIGCMAAIILIIAASGVAVALIIGINQAGIMLSILLPILIFAAVLAHLFSFYQNKRAIRRREISNANEWTIPSNYVHSQAQTSAPLNEDSWFKRFSQRLSTRSTPPPGYQTVFRTS